MLVGVAQIEPRLGELDHNRDLCLARLTDIIPETDDTRYHLPAPVAPEART